MKKYLQDIYDKLSKKYYYQPEYLNAIYAFLTSIDHSIEINEEIINLNIIERMLVPDRIITFKVPWVDDNGKANVNLGYRVQFNNAVGPYKGGTRFSPLVNESILKFLSFEQTFKNSLTNLPIGGAKGGSDFDPKGRSDLEIMSFCQNYMLELYKYIGPEIDVPAGDLGVGKKEIGYLYGMYKKITLRHNESLTGKDVSYGGSKLRPESTGYGLCYITEAALNKYYKTNFDKKEVIISGSGQVAIHAAYKAVELGARVVAMSSTKGFIYDKTGLDIKYIQQIKENNQLLDVYLEKYPKAIYDLNQTNLWNYKADIYLPSATQNEIGTEEISKIIKHNPLIISEGANRPLTNEAIDQLLESKIVFIPSKAANAGGVITSTFEMAQNATSSVWQENDVDRRIDYKMQEIFKNIYKTAESLGNVYNLVDGANIYAFKRLYKAMKYQGI